MRILGFGKKANEPQPPASTGDNVVETNNPLLSGILKAYAPEFLYNPPFGYPRALNVPLIRLLGNNPYVYSVKKTLCDEVGSTDWDIKVKEDCETTPALEELRKKIKSFLENPNLNKESFADLCRTVTWDIVDLDSGIWNKVYNKRGQLCQLFAKDGGSFLKNPDIYGYYGNREEIILPDESFYEVSQTGNDLDAMRRQYSLAYAQKAAYFQYGQSPTSLPVPFGRREIIYFQCNYRSNSIYGQSPIEILQDVILTLVYGANYNLDFYANGNMPEGIISVIGADKAQLKAMQDRLQAVNRITDTKTGLSRKVAFRIPWVNYDTKFTPFQLDPKTMDVVAQQEWFTKVVWMCFGVTPDEMGFTQDSNKSVGQTQKQTYIRKAVRPILSQLKYRIDHEIIPEWGEEAFKNLEFVWEEFDIDEDIKKATLYTAQLAMGIKTPEMIAEECGIDYEEVKKTQEAHLETTQATVDASVPTHEKEAAKEDSKQEKKSLDDIQLIQTPPAILKEEPKIFDNTLEEEMVMRIKEKGSEILQALDELEAQEKVTDNGN